MASTLLFGGGCATLLKKNEGTIGKASKAEAKAQTRVEQVNESIVVNDRQKLETIGVLAAGTDYALSKVPEPSVEIDVAREINARVLTLAEPANLSELKKMHSTIDDLTSALKAERERGLKDLAARDEKIYTIQLEKKALESAKDVEIKKYMDIAQAAAAKADQYSATLGDMDTYWGLGAVFYGVKRFITNSAIFLGIVLVLYLVLRIASTMSPVAAGIFQIFNFIASFFISAVKALAPGAAKLAKLVPEATSDLYKQTLGHIVDNLELLRVADKKAISAGQPVKKYTLEEIMTEFSKSMDQPHKDVVDDIKNELRWK